MASLCSEVDSEVFQCKTNESEDLRVGKIEVPNAGAIHNPTIAKEAENMEKTHGKRRFRSITGTFWCDSEEVRQQEFEKVTNVWLSELKFVCYGAIERTEENKKPHCHFLIMFNGQKQWSTIIKTLSTKTHHIEPARKVNAAYDYCRKEDPHNLLEYGKPPSQGARNDLKKLVEDCNASVEKIMETDLNTYARYRNGILDYCQYKQSAEQIKTRFKMLIDENNIATKDVERRAIVHWYYGPAGSGKTRTVEDELIKLYNARECSLETISVVDKITQPNNFFQGNIREFTDVLVIDDFRGSMLKYDELLKLLDGSTVNVKGGQKFIKAKHIFITSPMSPKACYRNLAANDGIDQLLRRITEIRKFGDNDDDDIRFGIRCLLD